MATLSSLPAVSYYLKEMPDDHELLEAIYRLAFGRACKGDGAARKRELGAFAGLGEGRDTTAVAAELRDSPHWKAVNLRDLARFFDCDASGDSAMLVSRAAEFMSKPYKTGRTECSSAGVPLKYAKLNVGVGSKSASSGKSKKKSSSSKKRSRSSSSSSASSSSSSPKKRAKKAPTPVKSATKKATKPKSAKFLYIQDRKDAAKAAYPTMDSTALAMKLIQEYKALPDNEKQKYQDRAAAEKKAFEEAQALLAEMEEMGDVGL